MTEDQQHIIDLPDDAMPQINELTGDLLLLAELVGVKRALRVAQAVGGTMLRIPKADRWLRRHRDKCMRRDFDSGASGTEVARKYGLGERQTWNILGSPEPDERQLKLF
jgi:Mor family transcriptional regulator